MSSLFIITKQSFLMLKRDKVFLPFIIACFVLIGFASQINEWAIGNQRSIFLNFSLMSFTLIGGIAAIFWGSRLLNQKDAFLDLPLSTAISRFIFLVGRYLGLCFALTLMIAAYLGLTQAFMFYQGLGTLNASEVSTFLMLGLEFLVLAALSILFSSLTSSVVALFSTFCLWVVGLLSGVLMQTVSNETPAFTRKLLEVLSTLWNLQHFNFIDYLNLSQPISPSLLIKSGIYGLTLVGLFISAAVLHFNSKDIT